MPKKGLRMTVEITTFPNLTFPNLTFPNSFNIMEPKMFERVVGSTHVMVQEPGKPPQSVGKRWDAVSNGHTADAEVALVRDGRPIQRQFFTLDHGDLDSLLALPSVPMPLHQRLRHDFKASASSSPRTHRPNHSHSHSHNRRSQNTQSRNSQSQSQSQSHRPHRRARRRRRTVRRRRTTTG